MAISRVIAEIEAAGVKLSTSLEDRLAYCKDYNPLHLHRLLRREVPALPDAVAFPRSIDDVSAVLRAASAHGVPVYVFGGASGVMDAATPYEGGIALSTLGLDWIEVDVENRLATAGAGVIGGKLEKALNAYGLTLRHSPQSLYCSTVGGWVATAASGQYSTGYGSIEDLVVSLTVVLPSGEVLEETKAPRRAGPDLKKLFIGSEGALGVVAEATLKVFDAPEEAAMLSLEYSSLREALAEARRLVAMKPALMRLFDEEESLRYFDVEKPTLIAIFEGQDASQRAEAAARALEGRRAEGYAETWMGKRFDVSDISRIVPLGFIFDTIEVACFWSSAERLYRSVIEAIRSVKGTVMASAHASHFYYSGLCFYFTFVGLPADIEEYYHEVWKQAMKASLESGGNITHHHGVGRLRKPWLRAEIKGYYSLLEKIKDMVDERRLLNKGVLLDT